MCIRFSFTILDWQGRSSGSKWEEQLKTCWLNMYHIWHWNNKHGLLLLTLILMTYLLQIPEILTPNYLADKFKWLIRHPVNEKVFRLLKLTQWNHIMLTEKAHHTKNAENKIHNQTEVVWSYSNRLPRFMCHFCIFKINKDLFEWPREAPVLHQFTQFYEFSSDADNFPLNVLHHSTAGVFFSAFVISYF